MNKDIEETRRVHEQVAQTEEFVQAIMAAMKKVPPHIAVSGLMSCLARVMYVSNLPIETVASGIAGVIEIYEREHGDGSYTREES